MNIKHLCIYIHFSLFSRFYPGSTTYLHGRVVPHPFTWTYLVYFFRDQSFYFYRNNGYRAAHFILKTACTLALFLILHVAGGFSEHITFRF